MKMNSDQLLIRTITKRAKDLCLPKYNFGKENIGWILRGKELAARATTLTLSIDKIVASSEKSEKMPVPIVLSARLAKEHTSKTKRQEISKFLDAGNGYNILGVQCDRSLLFKVSKITELNNIKTKLKEPDNNSKAITCIEDISRYEPQIDNNIPITTSAKIKLIDFGDSNTNKQCEDLLIRAFDEKKIAYAKTRYTDSLSVYKISSKQIKLLIEVLERERLMPAILSIGQMPKIKPDTATTFSTSSFPGSEPDPNRHYATLGILDDGISAIPQLKDWLSGERYSQYHSSAISPEHGTEVASVALYGDMLENKNFVGHQGIKLFDAAIFPKEGGPEPQPDEDTAITNIREAIETNRDVKTWNLSASIQREIDDDSFSDFAVALDSIQKRNQVLLCNACGNDRSFNKGRSHGRVNVGSDSVMSLTVGSLAHAKGVNDFAEPNNPSPFTRIGPGPEKIIKPDVVHYGGNAGRLKDGTVCKSGVTVINMSGEVAQDAGTSFSTPRVASLAAALSAELAQDFNPLLIKALIIHSASYPSDLKIKPKEWHKYVGFGLPKNISSILTNKPNEITLVLTDELPQRKAIEILDFPMPKSLIKDGFYTGQIFATLVSEPIIDPSQGSEYIQSNINLEIGTYLKLKTKALEGTNILVPVGRERSKSFFSTGWHHGGLYTKASGIGVGERALIANWQKFYPVKKYSADLSDAKPDEKAQHLNENVHWYLSLMGLYRAHSEERAEANGTRLKQKFALVITIRDKSNSTHLYNDFSTYLTKIGLVNNPISIRNEIKLNN